MQFHRGTGVAAMSERAKQKRVRRLEAAQGYLMLNMPDHALKEVASIIDPHVDVFAVSSLRGEALRQKGDHASALISFRKASLESPENIQVMMMMAWCYKRTDQLHRAIAMMQRAYHVAPREAVVLYNLSCYFSLVGDKPNALSWLGRAIRIDGSLRKLIPDETDFDNLRRDPDFQLIIGTKKAA
jgi:Flp pilus assembly protein TadD